MSKVVQVYERNSDGSQGAHLDSLSVGEEYVVIGVDPNMDVHVFTSVKWVSLPFFLLKALTAVILPDVKGSAACSG